MRVMYYNRSRVAPEIEAELNAEYVPRNDLLRRADHVVLVLPYTPASHPVGDDGVRVDAMANLAADNLIAALGHGPHAGHPPNPINPEVLGKARS